MSNWADVHIPDGLQLLGEKFTSGMAWIDLQMLGENRPSIRNLAARWKWSNDRVVRFLSKYEVKTKQVQEQVRGQVQEQVQVDTSYSDSYKESKYNDKYSDEYTSKYNSTASRTRVIDDSLSCEIDLFSNPPTHNQESKDSGCSAPQGAKAKRNVFTPPTVVQVTAYCQEQGFYFDPAEFVDHFESNGWLVSGKAKMKDWKAAVRNWARKDKKFHPEKYINQDNQTPPQTKQASNNKPTFTFVGVPRG